MAHVNNGKGVFDSLIIAGANSAGTSPAADGSFAIGTDDGDLSFGAGADFGLRWSDADVNNHAAVLWLEETNQALHITDDGAKDTDWDLSVIANPAIYIHSNTTPATEYLRIGAHNGTDANILSTAGLNISSVDELTLQINGVGLLEFDDSAISGFAGATDTVGQPVFIETQDAGPTATAPRMGGALNIKGGDGSIGTGTIDAGAGAAILITTGGGGAKTGTGAGSGGAGGAFIVTTSVGGATAATAGTEIGGAGGEISFVAAAGGAASAGTADGGQGASVSFTVGAGGTSAGGTAGVAGIVRADGPFVKAATVTAMTGTATITVAGILGGFIDANPGAAATYTMPDGTVFAAAIPSTFAVGDSIDFSIGNRAETDTWDITVAGDTGMTAVGNLTIEANDAVGNKTTGTFRIVKTGASAFSFYRIG